MIAVCDSEVQSLLNKGAIRVVTDPSGGLYSALFGIPKPRSNGLWGPLLI